MKGRARIQSNRNAYAQRIATVPAMSVMFPDNPVAQKSVADT